MHIIAQPPAEQGTLYLINFVIIIIIIIILQHSLFSIKSNW